MKIYLVRHGQTALNQQRRYQGTIDSPLDEKGLAQVQKVSNRLKDITWSGAIASDLARARVTGEMILAENENPILMNIMPEWREMNFGSWEGKTFTEIEERFPEKVSTFFGDPSHPIIPEGESGIEFQKRVLTGFEKVLDMGREAENWLIATHGGSIRIIICEVLGLPLKEMWELEQGNTAVNILNISSGGKMDFETLNDLSHLK